MKTHWFPLIRPYWFTPGLIGSPQALLVHPKSLRLHRWKNPPACGRKKGSNQPSTDLFERSMPASFSTESPWAMEKNNGLFIGYILGVAPSQDSSHHQDYEPFLVGDPYKPSFPTVTGRGPHPRYATQSCEDYNKPWNPSAPNTFSGGMKRP